MYHLETSDEWYSIDPNDLWIYNKLQLSRVLGYSCGPSGVQVPKPDFYIIRPSINFLGMGRYARKEFINDSTEHLHPGEFWCELFLGEHLSVDFKNKLPELIVLGERENNNPLYKWKSWEKVTRNVKFPNILENLFGSYEYINCEFIGNKLIEVHFRRNPDFRYNNSISIPVWNDQDIKKIEGYKFIEDKDYKRSGFYIK